ncbi:MAG TPA: rhomboid family intramembrane serine protease [Sphingomicrobium sp.]|nr:rhomboid family intramembrane serine protease [Sphingomicrobium sp.]
MLRLKSATAIIAIVTAVVSVVAFFAGLDLFVMAGAFIPARLSGLIDVPGALPAWVTPFSSALLHGNWAHLIINLVMLVFAGSQVERVVGGSGLLLAYIIGAIVAAAAQFVVDPASPVPMVGASGAISALFGLYAVYFGRPKQVTRNIRLNRAIHVAWLLATWVVLQWMTAVLAGAQGAMIATPAHIGGFIAGLLLHKVLLLWRYRKA